MEQAYQNFNSGKYKEALTYDISHLATYPPTHQTSIPISPTSRSASTSPIDVSLPQLTAFESSMIYSLGSSGGTSQQNSKLSALSSSIWQ